MSSVDTCANCIENHFMFSKYGMCEKQKFGSNSFLKIEPSKTLTAVQTVFQQKLHAIWHSNKSKLM